MLYRKSKEKRSVVVDLSPLIDVVFLLLIFLMVSTRFIDDYGLDLALPGSESRSSSQQTTTTVSIDKEGLIYVDKEEIAQADLMSRLKAALAEKDDKMIVVKADSEISHGEVVAVMNAAKEAGAGGLVFATAPGGGGASDSDEDQP